MSEITPDHQECIDLFLPERIKNKLAFSSTQLEMPNSVSFLNLKFV